MQIPANKLAEFITAKTTDRRERIVRQLMSGSSSHPSYYQCFHKPAKEFLLKGANDATGIVRVIGSLKKRNQTKWLTTDSEITAEALRALIKLGPELHGLHVEFVTPGARTSRLHLPEADISVPPNLLVHAKRNNRPLVGALRFYLAKESSYHLGARGAELVAVMQYLLLLQGATGSRVPDTDICFVVECMQQRITKAPADASLHIAAIKRGCRELIQLWHRLRNEEAA